LLSGVTLGDLPGFILLSSLGNLPCLILFSTLGDLPGFILLSTLGDLPVSVMSIYSKQTFRFHDLPGLILLRSLSTRNGSRLSSKSQGEGNNNSLREKHIERWLDLILDQSEGRW
jgi:hypothetical protein